MFGFSCLHWRNAWEWAQRNFQPGEPGKSPVGRYVEELRIETARRLLERTTQGMDEIADCLVAAMF
jgi:transcriptional regulator GlxA family with amidase domain